MTHLTEVAEHDELKETTEGQSHSTIPRCSLDQQFISLAPRSRSGHGATALAISDLEKDIVTESRFRDNLATQTATRQRPSVDHAP